MELNHTAATFSAFYIGNKGVEEKAHSDSVCDRILICKAFYNENLAGSFFSCIYNGKLRIHAVFTEDTDSFNEEVSELIKQSMTEAKIFQGKIWFKNTSLNVVTYIGDQFLLTPDSEQFFYDSTEYIMRRNQFHKTFDGTVLEVRAYEETHIDGYLKLLNDAMAFKIPPHDYVHQKAHYIQEFKDLKDKNSFEAFWKDGELVGLYWLEGIEIDHMAVSTHFQRTGYGSMILTRAIERVLLQNPDAEYAVLYCVGWNNKAQNFYQRYGMEMHGQHRVPYDDHTAV